MILIADSGSTKTDWAVVGAQERAFVSVSTQGINPLLFTDKQIDSVLSQELYPQLLKAGVEIEEVSDVYFYGAGCTVAQSPRVVARLSFLFSSAKIEAESDLLGAARAVLGHNKVLRESSGQVPIAASLMGRTLPLTPLHLAMSLAMREVGLYWDVIFSTEF